MPNLKVDELAKAKSELGRLEEYILAYLGLIDDRHELRVSWRPYETTHGQSIKGQRDFTHVISSDYHERIHDVLMRAVEHEIRVIMIWFHLKGINVDEKLSYLKGIGIHIEFD